MLLVGTLEQLNLANILQRAESHAKTGRFVIKQGELRVELYVRDGRLMYIGPARTTLGERLLQAGIISQEALRQVMLALGASEPSETRMAITLMDMEHVSRDDLRAWAVREYTRIMQVLLSWTAGEISFEEERQPPAESLLIALPISSFLPPPSCGRPAINRGLQYPAPEPASADSGTPANAMQEQSKSGTADISNAQTLLSAAQFLPETSPSSPAPVSFASPDPSGSIGFLGSLLSASELSFNTDSPSYLSPPVQVTTPVPPQRINTSFMGPEMVMIPTDLSELREQNPQFQITPDQWRLFTRADGRTTLQMACQELGMSAEQVCTIAGELVALRLVQILPVSSPTAEPSLATRNAVPAGLGNGYVVPGYAASPVNPWTVAVLPTTDALPPSRTVLETQSQWGNGGNGTVFVPGHGWVLTTQLGQSLPSGPLTGDNRAYVQVGGRR